MKKKTQLTALGIIALTTLGAAAATYTVTKLAVRPAVRVYQPVSNDTVNTKGKKFDTGALLLQRNDADFTRGTSTEALMGADSTFTFAKPAKGQEIYITQTTVRPADFFTGKLKVWCNTPFAILVNGKEQGTKTTWQDSLNNEKSLKTTDLKIESEINNVITVKILASDTAAAPVMRMQVVPDKNRRA